MENVEINNNFAEITDGFVEIIVPSGEINFYFYGSVKQVC